MENNKTIIIDGENYVFEEQEFYLGMKKIDREVSRLNLILLKEILSKYNLKFGLIYGTLLGAIRENNFIEHDQDTDIYILKEDKQNFLKSLFELRDNGFELGRADEELFSLTRKGEYIDIYIFKKSLFFYRKNARQYINKIHFDGFDSLPLFDTDFNIPLEPIKFLEKHYGKNWKTPIKNRPAKSRYFIGKYKEIIKRVFTNYS